MESFDPPPPTYRGRDAVGELPEALPVSPADADVVVLTDEGVRAAGIADRVTRSLPRSTVVDGVESNPSVALVESVAERVRDTDVAVGVGGGSVMDTAKVASTLPAFGSFAALQEASADETPPRPGATVPLVLVPTTAGTGSETGRWAVVSDHDRREKLSVGHPTMRATAAVLDPTLTVSVPPYLTAATGADVLTHAVEALTATGATPLTEPYAVAAFEWAASTLERAVRAASGSVPGDDGASSVDADEQDGDGDGQSETGHEAHLSLRERLLDASYLAGVAMNNAGLGATHAISHAIGGCHDTPHGHTNAALLPHVVRENARRDAAARTAYGRLAETVDATDAADATDLTNATDGGETLATTLAELVASVGLDRPLPGAPDDVTDEAWDWDVVADRAVENVNMETNPVPFDRETVREICRRAFGGDHAPSPEANGTSG